MKAFTKRKTVSKQNKVTAVGANQNLSQVLTVGNSAGSKKITNLLDGTNAQDAATINQLFLVWAKTLVGYADDETLVLTPDGAGGFKWQSLT